MSTHIDRRPAILVVEDDEIFSIAVERYIRNIVAGACEVLQVTDGRAALAELERHDVLLVITDYQLLSSMNGLKVAGAIRQRVPTARIALITAYATDDIHPAAAEVGVDYYLPKPFLLQDLEPIVRSALARA